MKSSQIPVLAATVCTLWLVSFNGQAQNSPSEQAMQTMMVEIQKLQACMEAVDRQGLEQLQSQSRQVHADLKTMCANGDRRAAQARAMSYSKEMLSHPSIVAMRRCQKMMEGMRSMLEAMPQIPDIGKVFDASEGHVCDAIN